MTKRQIIESFRLYYDDGTSLSTAEESALFDKIYLRILSDRPWEFLKKAFEGTTSTSIPYIALPSDFQYLTANANYTDSSYEASRPVVFRGVNYSPYQVVSFSDRRQYRNQSGFAYIDIVNSRLYFTAQPQVAEAVEFDYAYFPTTSLTLDESPVFPERFHYMIYHGMVVDQNFIEMSDKAKSYAPENQSQYNQYLVAMAFWNSQLIQM